MADGHIIPSGLSRWAVGAYITFMDSFVLSALILKLAFLQIILYKWLMGISLVSFTSGDVLTAAQLISMNRCIIPFWWAGRLI